MTSRRRSFTLIQLLASVALVALPLAFFAPVVREESGRFSRTILVALAAFCVELEAFHWLVLTPAVRACLDRWRGDQTTRGPLPGDSPGFLRDRVVLAAGPCLAMLLPVVGWGAGYRLPGFMVMADSLTLFLAPMIVIMLLDLARYWTKIRAPLSQWAATVVLALLAIPCIFLIDPASAVGRRRLEQELGVRLARECFDVLESHRIRGVQVIFDRDQLDELGSAAIRRLRPRDVVVEPGGLTIELHGGFEHHRYELIEDRPNGQWVFQWHHPEAGELRQLLTWPIGTRP